MATYRTLIDAPALIARLADHLPTVLLDCRFDLLRPEAGEASYLAAHLPGAVYAHLDRDLSGPKNGRNGRHPLPDRAAFAARTGLDWSSRELACTAYWRPERDGKRRCEGSALDHLFASRPPKTMEAKGPCESVGCEPGDRCPLFYDEVSDHCPILGQW